MRSDVTVSAAEQKAIAAFLANPPKTVLVGQCSGCSRGIPLGYPCRVTAWETLVWEATMPSHQRKVSIPRDVWCKECVADDPRYKQAGPQSTRRPHKHHVKEEPVKTATKEETLSLRDIAKSLFAQTSTEEGHGSKVLAKMAGIDADQYGDMLIPVLKKLAEAGKVEFREKQWYRV